MTDHNYQEKDVAFYSATLGAWYTTKFEKDKHLLSLSAAAIGLLVTLLTTVGASTYCAAIMYFLALLCFIICIISVLIIFSRNAIYLQKVAFEDTADDMMLSILDKASNSSFLLGILFTVLLGAFSATANFQLNMEFTMTDDTNKMVNTSSSSIDKSANGASAMRPSQPSSTSSSSSSSSSGNSSSESSSSKK